MSTIKMLNSLLPYMLELTQEKPKLKITLRENLLLILFYPSAKSPSLFNITYVTNNYNNK